MATSQFGTLKEFNSNEGSITSYLERVELYFTANSVPGDEQVPILLTCIGTSTYTLLSDLLAPSPPSTKSLAEITDVLRKHFEPKRAIIAERYHFHKRNQAVGESIADYDVALRKLATNCKFGDYLEDALRDRFVCGLSNEAIQRRLLSEPDLTLTKAMDLAQAMEAAERNSKSLKGTEFAIRKLRGKPLPRPRTQQPCYRCGKSNHSPIDCKFKDVECHACGKKGHIAPVCRTKHQKRTNTASGRIKKPFRANVVNEDSIDTTDSDSDEHYLLKLRESSSHPMEATVSVEDKPLVMEVDTGAAVSIISEATRTKLFPHLKLRKSKVVLKTYTDEPIQVKGQLNVHVNYNGQTSPLKLVVVDGAGPNLFGRNWLKYIRLDWHRIATVQSGSQGVQALLQQHSNLFKDELGTVTSYKATLHIKPEATPKFFKPRRVPFAIKDAVGKELDRLEQQGIIRKVDHSEWAAPIVVVPKKDGRFRLCGDYKVTINQALSIDQYPLPKPADLFASWPI